MEEFREDKFCPMKGDLDFFLDIKYKEFLLLLLRFQSASVSMLSNQLVHIESSKKSNAISPIRFVFCSESYIMEKK